MSVGGARGDVGCGVLQGRNIEDASRHDWGYVGADGLANGDNDGHVWCHKRIDIGHRTRQGVDGPVTTSLAVSRRLSPRLFVCPALVRPAPDSSYFPSRFVPPPPPPVHSAFGGDDVCDRTFSFPDVGPLARPPFFAVASAARPVSSVSFSSVGSSSSHDSCHSVGSQRLPSQSVASSCRSMRFRQSSCCGVSTHKRVCWLLFGSTARKG